MFIFHVLNCILMEIVSKYEWITTFLLFVGIVEFYEEAKG